MESSNNEKLEQRGLNLIAYTFACPFLVIFAGIAETCFEYPVTTLTAWCVPIIIVFPYILGALYYFYFGVKLRSVVYWNIGMAALLMAAICLVIGPAIPFIEV